MVDFFKQCIESLSERVRSPILGTIFLSLIFWNWKILFVLFFSNWPVIAKLWFVEVHANLFTSLICPVASGFLFALFLPVLTFIGAFCARYPKHWLYSLEQDEGTKRETVDLRVKADKLNARTEFEEAQAQAQAQEETKKIEDEERRVKAASVSPELEQEIVSERAKQDDTIQEMLIGAILKGSGHVNVVARYIIKLLADSNEPLDMSMISEFAVTHMSGSTFANFGTTRRANVVIDTAISRLDSLKLLKESMGKYTLTITGYELADRIAAKNDPLPPDS